jgi:branched-subunit amino acid transport protein AzlD
VSTATKGLIVLAGVIPGIYALKAAAPLVLGTRPLPKLIALMARVAPAALLAALVVASSATRGKDVVVDARLAGVVVAAVALWRKAGFIVTVVLAVATTALVRMFT